MNIDDRIPQHLQPLIADYDQLGDRHIAGLIKAFYIVGSIALGEFNEHFSDIDFIAILARPISSTEIGHLCSVHRFIETTYPRWKMSGSYIQEGELGQVGNTVATCPHYHDGRLHPAARSPISRVTWWELKNHGIPLFGAEPRTLPFTVDWDLLLWEMKANLNSYWRSWTNQPRKIITLYSDWGIQWAVLGVLRQYYTLRKNSITTKIRAGDYALGCLPGHWHSLIREAIRIRKRDRQSFYRSRLHRMRHTVRFLDYIINLCNESVYPSQQADPL